MKFWNKILRISNSENSELDWLKELDWANVYHDSIRGKPYLESLSLNIGRWAGNYAFFYLLNRIIHLYEPVKIIEFGLGESTKFITSCIRGLNYDCHYLVVEQNRDWKTQFESNFEFSNMAEILYCPLERKDINGYNTNSYKDLRSKIDFNAELYVVDGPHGSDRFSRFDICFLVEDFNKKSEFIILMDDCQRQGEQDTFLALENILKEKGIYYFMAEYKGVKTVKLLVSRKYKNSITF